MTLYKELAARATSTEALNDGPCWAWRNALLPGGYGIVHAPGHSSRLAHRVSYELAHGAIPAHLDIDHTCRTRACYRPSHLRAVTHRDNCLADGSMCWGGREARKTHCPRGHELSGDNLLSSDLRRGFRGCRTCERNRSARRRALARKAA